MRGKSAHQNKNEMHMEWRQDSHQDNSLNWLATVFRRYR